MKITITESQSNRLKAKLTESMYPEDTDILTLYDNADVVIWDNEDELKYKIRAADDFTPTQLARLNKYIQDNHDDLDPTDEEFGVEPDFNNDTYGSY